MKTVRHREGYQPEQCKAHPYCQCIRLRPFVRKRTYKWLKHRRTHLECKCNEPDLRKTEVERIFHHRVNRRNERLHRVVQQVGEAQRQKDWKYGLGGGNWGGRRFGGGRIHGGRTLVETFHRYSKCPRLPVYASRGPKKNDKGIDSGPHYGRKPNKILFAMDYRCRRLGSGENGNVCNRNTVRCINGVEYRIGDVTRL